MCLTQLLWQTVLKQEQNPQLLQKKVRLESELDNSVVRKGREATDRGSGCGEFLIIR